MKRAALLIAAPRQITLIHENLKAPGAGEVTVETDFSSVSAGTELLIYRGQAPTGLAADESLPHLFHPLTFPLRYGYSAVGRITRLGKGVGRSWKGRRIFAFHPHADGFTIPLSFLQPVPNNISSEEALFLPNMESAVNFVMDGAPLLGERVAVLGQGIVGLLTTALLTRFPLASLVAVDGYPLRQIASVAAGARVCLKHSAPHLPEKLKTALGGEADIVFELSGNPEALNTAIQIAGFDGRIVVGSWYGKRKAALNLGGDFHRKRIKIISSQVTTVAPSVSGRFSKARRFDIAWQAIHAIHPSRWITHRFPFEEGADAFDLLNLNSKKALQVVLVYSKRVI